jgi:tetratricopeptide (TPR) repeat protein
MHGSRAEPVGLGWRYRTQPVATPRKPAPPPPDYPGAIGRRVAGRVGLARGRWEAERGRLMDAAVAAGLGARFGDQLVELGHVTARPALYELLPAITPVFLYAPWQAEVLGDDLAWRAERPAAPLPAGAPVERRLLAGWHALLSGEPGAAEAIARFDRGAELATARMLVAIQRVDLAEAILEAMVDRRPRDAGALIVLSAVRGNQGDLRGAEELLLRALAIDPRNADAHARLGLAQAKQGRLDEARLSWARALALDPDRADVADWLRALGG